MSLKLRKYINNAGDMKGIMIISLITENCIYSFRVEFWHNPQWGVYLSIIKEHILSISGPIPFSALMNIESSFTLEVMMCVHA